MMAITVDDLVEQLESFDGWESVSFGKRHGRPCILIHNNSELAGYIQLSDEI